MARESTRCCATTVETSVASLEAIGMGLRESGAEVPCPFCSCLMGGHAAVMPGDITDRTLFDRTGWIECPTCDVSCGTWAVHEPA